MGLGGFFVLAEPAETDALWRVQEKLVGETATDRSQDRPYLAMGRYR
jgi:hypothetical protein